MDRLETLLRKMADNGLTLRCSLMEDANIERFSLLLPAGGGVTWFVHRASGHRVEALEDHVWLLLGMKENGLLETPNGATP